MITPPGALSTFLYGLLLTLPFNPIVPVAALAGAALLTFARIIRLGAAMDDEIKGTV
jgi:hypothetical protein